MAGATDRKSDALQLVEIAQTDSDYGKKRQWGYSFPLKFHRAMLKKMQRHATRVEDLWQKHHVPETWFSNDEDQIASQKINELLAISSSRWPGDRKEIMGTGWSYGLAAAARVYDVLKGRLAASRLSSRCLLMLAPIIASPDDRIRISTEALRIALTRRK